MQKTSQVTGNHGLLIGRAAFVCRQEVELHISLSHDNIVKFKGACCDIPSPQPGNTAYEHDVPPPHHHPNLYVAS